MKDIAAFMAAISVLTLSFLTTSFSQPYIPRAERGNSNARRSSVIDTNNVRTTVFNFGYSGRTTVDLSQYPYEWPKGTGQDYIALNGILVGGKVRDDNDSLISIVDVPHFRSSPQGLSWNFEPVPEFQNPSSTSLARSDDPSTWPAVWPDKMGDTSDRGWPGSWNGILGKNKFIKGTEIYNHFADDGYSRYSYIPDTTDTTRKGIGIVVGRRVLEFTDSLIRDAVLFVDDIYNAGTKDILNAGTTYWIADLVGGDGDSNDDYAWINMTEGTAFFLDRDGLGNKFFGLQKVGAAGFAFLQTPHDIGMTRFQYLPAGAINFSTTGDDYFWNTFIRPPLDSTEYYNPGILRIGDYDGFASCGLFPLTAGTSERVVTAMVFGPDTTTVARIILYLKNLVAGGYAFSPVDVAIQSLQSDTAFHDTATIHWNAADNDPSLKIDLYLKQSPASPWTIFAHNLPNTGSYEWLTKSASDGVMNQIRIVAFDSTRLGQASFDGIFTVNHPDSLALPQVYLEKTLAGGRFVGIVDVGYIAGDADTTVALLTIIASADSLQHSDTVFSGYVKNGRGNYQLNTSALANSTNCSLEAIVTKGRLSAVDNVGPFTIDNPRYHVADADWRVSRSTVGTGIIEVHVVDTTQLNGHRYDIVFKSSPPDTVYDVVDSTISSVVLGSQKPGGMVESPMFDGIRLYVRNDTTNPRLGQNAWNSDSVEKIDVHRFRFGVSTGIVEMGDYVLRVGDVGMDTSLPLRLSSGHINIPLKAVNFTVFNKTTGRRVPFAFWEVDGNSGMLSASQAEQDLIILLTKDKNDSLVPSWQFQLVFDQSKLNPRPGDSVVILMKKSFIPGDTYSFTAMTHSGTMAVREGDEPRTYALYQNYPNPFNPHTTINFFLPKRNAVQLEIYNTLGQKIRTLHDGAMEQGLHSLVWNGKDGLGKEVSSGVYLYRILSGDFHQTKKMILIR